MTIPQLAQAFIDSEHCVWMDNGCPPRNLHDYGYDRKIAVCQHIPVCETLDDLDAYFCGGWSEGSTHFGVDRALHGELVSGGWHIPVARVSQYMPIRRDASYPSGCSPWAQGVLNYPTAVLAQGMDSGEPNGAFHSIENVAWTGADGMTDAQFNSNVLLTVYLAGLDEYPIDPEHDLGHFEIDTINRPEDTGWAADLWDARQAAANLLLANNDPSGLKGAWQEAAAPPSAEASPPISLHESQVVSDTFGAGTIVVPQYLFNIGPGYTVSTEEQPEPQPIAEGTPYRGYYLYVPVPLA